MSAYIVIKQWITSYEQFTTEYQWDGQRHTSHQAAVSAGFRQFGCDDFNVGRVELGRLVWFGWMNDELSDYDRDKIASLIGLVAR